MQIREERQKEILILKIEGVLDSKTAPLFEGKIDEAIAQGARQMILDFKNLEYISSAGLRVILKTTKEMKRLEGKLVLCDLADYVKEVFEISGFDSFLPITASCEDAKGLF